MNDKKIGAIPPQLKRLETFNYRFSSIIRWFQKIFG